jgi:cyclopropane fatty-acyl-phospholipid synthase-like methyltransferase
MLPSTNYLIRCRLKNITKGIGMEVKFRNNIEETQNKPKSVWEEFFKDKKHGGHRYSSEEFLAIEAREKLFHLNGGKKLLDFGCGAAELLTYYALEYEKLVGVDFSPSMLAEASKRMKEKSCENVDLILADHENLWEKLDSTFDRITAAGVVQYLTLQEMDKFIHNASKYLNSGGKIILFDILDPRLYPLWKLGIFTRNAGVKKILYRVGCDFRTVISASLKNRPKDVHGFCHNPYQVEKIANKNGFEMRCVQSMYYEYKYHAILS